MTAVPVEFEVGACPSCGRWITPTNQQVGQSCRLCLTVWLTDEPDYLEPRPVAYWPAGIETPCAGCGHPTYGTDLCLRCDATSDLWRAVH